MRTISQRGFTLLELLVVLVIAGIILGVVSLNAIPSERQAMRNDAQRIALLLQLARDEAIVRNRLVAFELAAGGYRFMLRENDEWRPIERDESLRERSFSRTPVTFTIEPPIPQQDGRFRIVFGREPVDKPFLLKLAAHDASVSVRADGIGHFVVE